MISSAHIWTSEKTGLFTELNHQNLSKWQRSKLEEVIDYARNNTEFYKNIQKIENGLSDLPFTSPLDIAADPLSFLAIPQSSVARVSTLTTSGTTGIQKRIFFSDDDIERTKDYFAAGMKTLMGAGQHAVILISDQTENSLGSSLKAAIERIGCSAKIATSLNCYSDALKAIQDADCIIGMPAEIHYLSRKAPDLRPKSILLTADYIPEKVIESLAKIWSCEVFSHYGLTEIGFGYAVDCIYHNGYHLRDAEIMVEIIDPVTGKPVLPGMKGEIVLTTLSNQAMPLIRYRTGDISRMIHQKCGCGSSLPRLGRVEGRYDNIIQLKSGRTISIHQLDEIIFSHSEIIAYKAFVSPNDCITLHIESNAEVSELLLKEFFPEINIKIISCTCDPYTKRGKRRIYDTDKV